METSLTPAAQYLRMSTDQQQYSLVNQSEAIARYAVTNGFQIVKTYSDPARRGVSLKRRKGLKQLLKDVVDGQLDFRIVLVYDVSRWGRFQDIDESAHYEYLCKSAGVPVYYCAEVFTNSNSLADSIMKSLKRMMAGEYSRELGVKIRAGLFRLATMGYRVGGPPGYGFRRQLLDSQGRPKQLLTKGEHKSLATDRVILVPGSPDEVATIQRIFREFVDERRNVHYIARGLNRDTIPFLNGATWAPHHVTHLLKNPLYFGTQVWGRSTARLFTRSKKAPPEQWATCSGAFTAIIPKQLFDRAQERFANFTWRLSNEQLLEKLQKVLEMEGKINSRIVATSQLCPNVSTYYERFGGLLNAYKQLGMLRPELISSLNSRQKIRVARRKLIECLLKEFPTRILEVRRSRARSLLKDCGSGTLIEVAFARAFETARRGRFWLLDCRDHRAFERHRITLVALLNAEKDIEELRLFPAMSFAGNSIRLYKHTQFFLGGARLENIADFLYALEELRGKALISTSS